MEKVIIVGAGLVGSLQAILMAKKGYDVHVFERRPDLRNIELVGGRSINLALSTRGWKALEYADMVEEIETISIPMTGRLMHDKQSNLTYQQYGKEGEAIYSVSRGDLNKRLLLKATTYSNVTFHFNQRCNDIDLDSNTLYFEDVSSGMKTQEQAVIILGTDGAFSAVRTRMMKTDRFNFSQTYLSHGYKELLLAANSDGTHQIEKNALHIWPRGEYMLIALPNLDGSYTCTLFFPHQGPTSFESLKSKEHVEDFFKEEFPDFYELLPHVAEEYFANPDASLVTVRCEPWNYGGKVLLMGDASHAIVPFYGQGMNSGFEDCSVFHELHEKHGNNWDELFEDFAVTRKPDGDAIAELALNNYIEMRDKVGDEDFLLRKKIEKKVFEQHPDVWIPLYSQVTFSHIRYSDALNRGKAQERIMDQIMSKPTIHANWDDQVIVDEIVKAASAI